MRTAKAEAKEMLSWLSDQNRRWLSLLILVMYLFVATTATAIRYSWRMGFQEPASRMEYALVATFADSVFIFGVLVTLLAVSAPVYRIYYGGQDG